MRTITEIGELAMMEKTAHAFGDSMEENSIYFNRNSTARCVGLARRNVTGNNELQRYMVDSVKRSSTLYTK